MLTEVRFFVADMLDAFADSLVSLILIYPIIWFKAKLENKYKWLAKISNGKLLLAFYVICFSGIFIYRRLN